MIFKVGDQVAVIDETLNGKIVEILETKIVVALNNGFYGNYNKNEIIKYDYPLQIDINQDDINTFKINDIASKPIKKQNKKDDTLWEIDLHAETILKSTKNMNNFNILNYQMGYAKSKLEIAIKKQVKKLIFIHGVGEGVLKMELETFLRRQETVLQFYNANFQRYGNGAMEVLLK